MIETFCNRWSAGVVVIAAITIPFATGVLSPSRLNAASTQVNADPPAFEVASIKRNTSGDGRVFIQTQPGRFVATNVTLKMLIRNAYRLQDFQISGGPSWLDADHYDIVGKIGDSAAKQPSLNADPSAPTPLQLMMRALLADRFRLVVHPETKDLPVYALVVARKDGRLGPALHKSDVDCAALAGQGRSAEPPQPPGPPMQCGIKIGMGSMSVNAGTLTQLANSLGMFVGRTVLDKTGLTGGFDFNLTWAPDQMPNVQPGAPPPNAPPPPPADAPSIYTALQEQLGLKLDSTRGPVAVLVIDSAEHPSEN